MLAYHAMTKEAGQGKASPLRALFWELAKTWVGPVIVGVSAFLLYPFDWLTALSATGMALAWGGLDMPSAPSNCSNSD